MLLKRERSTFVGQNVLSFVHCLDSSYHDYGPEAIATVHVEEYEPARALAGIVSVNTEAAF